MAWRAGRWPRCASSCRPRRPRRPRGSSPSWISALAPRIKPPVDPCAHERWPAARAAQEGTRMPRDDYIRRLIVEMGRMWSRLVGLIKSRRLPAARAAIAEAYQQILGLPADAAQTFAPRELVARLMIG